MAPHAFTPPPAVRDAARRALDLRASLPPSRRCCTSVGLARARDLAHGRPVSVATLRRMASFFARHEPDRRGAGWGVDSRGWQAHLAWGGDAGREWARATLAGLEGRTMDTFDEHSAGEFTPDEREFMNAAMRRWDATHAGAPSAARERAIQTIFRCDGDQAQLAALFPAPKAHRNPPADQRAAFEAIRAFVERGRETAEDLLAQGARGGAHRDRALETSRHLMLDLKDAELAAASRGAYLDAYGYQQEAIEVQTAQTQMLSTWRPPHRNPAGVPADAVGAIRVKF